MNTVVRKSNKVAEAEPAPAVEIVAEGPETTAAIAAQKSTHEGVPAAVAEQEAPPEPQSWAMLEEGMSLCDDDVLVAELLEWLEAADIVPLFGGTSDLFPDEWGIYCGADSNTQSAMLRYILERAPSAETLFLKMQEWDFRPGVQFEDLLPVERAGFEFLTAVVPALAVAVAAMRAEAIRRAPPPEAPPAAPVPIEETSLEQVPAFGERMEG